jgi:ribonuclease-3
VDDALELLEGALGYRFKDRALLETALNHRSHAYERGTDALASYERLEFLGDALLGLLVADWLYRDDDAATEGALSRRRQSVVRTSTLADTAVGLGLGQAIRLGRGEELSGGRGKSSLLADVFEAVLGAIYLDGGLEAARALVVREFGEALRAPPEAARDPKSRLQELLQQQGTLPSYALVSSSDSAQDPRFEVEVRVDDRAIGRGEGRSKRAAERAAALRALEELAE